MKEELLSKVKELIAGTEDERKLGIQLAFNWSEENPWAYHRFLDLHESGKDILCTFVKWEEDKHVVETTFIKFEKYKTVENVGMRVLDERSGKHIHDSDILNLEEGFWIAQEVTIHLSIWDRIMVLFGAKFNMRAEHSVDKEVIVSKGTARITIGKPKVRMSQMSLDQDSRGLFS